jgi:putative ABC transport system permease protein
MELSEFCPTSPPADRFMRFPALVFRNVARRRFRTGLTLLALATAMAAIVALLGVSKGFQKSFAEVYDAHAVDVVVSRQGSADRLSSSLDAGVADRIATLPAVDRAAGVLLDTLSLEKEGIFGIPTMGVTPGSWLLADYAAVPGPDGSADPPALSGDRDLLVGRNLADRLGVRRGDTLLLFDEPYRVAGVFRSRSVWENGSLILPLATLQRIADRDGQVTYVNVVLRRPLPPGGVAAAVAGIGGLDPRLLALATGDFVRTDTRMQLAGAMAWMTSIVAIVIGAIGTLNTMMTSVHERTREIGILRAIGWPRRRVVGMILLESCGLAVVAAVLGGAAAAVLTGLLARAPAAAGILRPVIDPPILLTGFAIALGIGLLGAWLPAWRAAGLLPTEAFRDQQ